MPTSLSSRLYGLGILVSVAMIAATALLLAAADRTRTAFLYVGQNEEVIRTVDEMIGDVREAESGQRGFLLTHAPAYLDSFNERIESAVARSSDLARAVVGTDQAAPVKGIRQVLAAKVTSLRKPLALAQSGRFDEATAFVASGRGRSLMEDLSRRSDEVKSAEQSMLRIRMEDAQAQAGWNHDVLVAGGPIAALLFFALVFMLVRSFRRPLDALMSAIQALGAGQLETRAASGTGLLELDRLAASYNDMADRLTTAMERQAASDGELSKANEALRTRGIAIELLGGMAHRMQAAHTDEELADVVRCFLPRVLHDAPGALYVHNGQRNLLTRIAEWGAVGELPEAFTPQECWALRRGQGHYLTSAGQDVRCRHVGAEVSRYHCEPVLAGGEVVGLLYLQDLVTDEDRFRLSALTENIALALVNQRLQRGLREQSIRDPLTNLFNRRYLEEALAIETARATRANTGIGILMCDVDHFKRFNDEFGHEAGDAVLQAVSAEIHAHFREGDIACRYGGEEFAVIAPGAELEFLAGRADKLRQAIKTIAVHHDGRSLGRVTLSIGVAEWRPEQGISGSDTIGRADAALYRAKQAGRDQVAVAPGEPLALAAE